MPFKCVVPGCDDTVSTRHHFPNPKKSLNRLREWLEAIGNEKLRNLDPVKLYNNYRICHRHFAAEQCCTNMYLLPEATPTLHLFNRGVTEVNTGTDVVSGLLDESSPYQTPALVPLKSPEVVQPLEIMHQEPTTATKETPPTSKT